MRLVPAHSVAHSLKTMTTAQTIRTWMLDTLKSTNMSVDEWARRSGVARSTIFRALREDYEFVTSSRTLSKLASSAGVQAPDPGGVEPLFPPELVDMPIVHEVAAGAWREVDDLRDEPFGSLAVPRLPQWASYPQWLERVVGDSYDLKIPDGSLVHVIDAIDLNYEPRNGDTVIVVRRRAQGALIERSLKEVVIEQGRFVQLWPRSHNSRWNKPLDLTDGAKADEDIEVQIVGKVIRSYQTFD